MEPEFAVDAVVSQADVYMTTVSGIQYRIFDPDIRDFNIIDVATALANNCRFNGHVPYHYSNAEHSVHVHDLYVKMFKKDATRKRRRTALMHDAAETYLPDMHSALKHHIPEYMKLLRMTEDRVAEAFDLEWPESKDIKLCDGIMLSTELCILKAQRPYKYKPLPNYPFKPITPAEARNLFLARWAEVC